MTERTHRLRNISYNIIARITHTHTHTHNTLSFLITNSHSLTLSFPLISSFNFLILSQPLFVFSSVLAVIIASFFVIIALTRACLLCSPSPYIPLRLILFISLTTHTLSFSLQFSLSQSSFILFPLLYRLSYAFV